MIHTGNANICPLLKDYLISKWEQSTGLSPPNLVLLNITNKKVRLLLTLICSPLKSFGLSLLTKATVWRKERKIVTYLHKVDSCQISIPHIFLNYAL